MNYNDCIEGSGVPWVSITLYVLRDRNVCSRRKQYTVTHYNKFSICSTLSLYILDSQHICLCYLCYACNKLIVTDLLHPDSDQQFIAFDHLVSPVVNLHNRQVYTGSQHYQTYQHRG